MGKKLKEEDGILLAKEAEKISGISFEGFGDGVFTSSKSLMHFTCKDHGEICYPFTQVKLKVTKGRLCPRCKGGSGKLTEAERVTRAEDACKKLNLEFLHCEHDFGYKSRITYKCLKCKTVHDARLGNLEHGKGCPQCKLRTISEKRSNHEEALKDLNIVAKTKNLSILRIDKQNHKGGVRSFIFYKCNSCGKENKSHGSYHFKSLVGCSHCLGHHVKSLKELEEISLTQCLARGYKVDGEKIITEYKYTRSKLNLICPNGHKYNPSFNSFTRVNPVDCPCLKKCGFSIDKPAYFYLLKFTSSEGQFLKFGITKSLTRRLRELKRGYSGMVVETLYRFHSNVGKDCKDLEDKMKIYQKSVGGAYLEVGDGYTETISVDHLEELTKIIIDNEKSIKAVDNNFL